MSEPAIEMPSVSAIIPTRNSASTIGKCLSSLVPYFEDGYVDEIVVVDAFSTDRTVDIVRRFPVRLMFDRGKNPYVAREMGWRSSKGELILFMDSDTYLGSGFFPRICEFFENQDVGIVGAWSHGVIENAVTRAVGEWWVFHGEKLKAGQNERVRGFNRMYLRVSGLGYPDVTVTGPCFIVRRKCLETVNGFSWCEGSADHTLSHKIRTAGWTAMWWVDAPLFHHPPATVRELLRQRHRWGKLDAFTHKNDLRFNVLRRASVVIYKLGGSLVGAFLISQRFRNLTHLWLLPVSMLSWTIGYITTR